MHHSAKKLNQIEIAITSLRIVSLILVVFAVSFAVYLFSPETCTPNVAIRFTVTFAGAELCRSIAYAIRKRYFR